MGILDNLEAYLENSDGKPTNTESAWDQEFSFEHKSIPLIDNMGREVFWEDLGRPDNDGLALKIFKEDVCQNCSCQE